MIAGLLSIDGLATLSFSKYKIMTSEYLDPEDEVRDSKKSEERTNPSANQKANASLEKKGPVKDENFKVLNRDRSLSDHPYNNQAGGGALEGTIGIGT
jgi:hypothetical protein